MTTIPNINEIELSTHARRRDQIIERNMDYLLNPEKFHPFWKPCKVRILLVADGFLYFSDEDFGLSDLIDILSVPPGPYVRFEITVAHRDNVTDAQIAIGNPKVKRSIKNFNFDNSAHFTKEMYDEIWLFGANVSFKKPDNTWTNKPSDRELRIMTEFMNSGKGVFATGDHGALGAGLCGHVPRVRSMRRWFSSVGPFGEPVAPDMTSGQRNDTNRPGHDTDFEFDDQSDDIPQEIEPTMYTIPLWYLKRVIFPHPLLCGPKGVIRVLPDHPHEGECMLPHETNRIFTFDGINFPEYPNSTIGRSKPLPEIVAKSRVLAGNNVKDPTVAQVFNAICAYEGDRAKVGRIVTDATWHHFIDINLTGAMGGVSDPEKSLGFLASPIGMAHYENIKAYFRNIAVWLAPKDLRQCMRNGGVWIVIWSDRLIESVTPGLPLKLTEVDFKDIIWIGRHARDVLGRFAGRCQSYEWIIGILEPFVPRKILDVLCPWCPKNPKQNIEPDPLPWFDPEPLMEIALGGAIIAIREQFPDPNSIDSERAEKEIPGLIERGAQFALQQSYKSLEQSYTLYSELNQGIKEISKGKTES